jgi:hypothetical protein
MNCAGLRAPLPDAELQLLLVLLTEIWHLPVFATAGVSRSGSDLLAVKAPGAFAITKVLPASCNAGLRDTSNWQVSVDSSYLQRAARRLLINAMLIPRTADHSTCSNNSTRLSVRLLVTRNPLTGKRSTTYTRRLCFYHRTNATSTHRSLVATGLALLGRSLRR